ncbi:unnamed protein product [Meganyctiphanes norvegica]|uniref:Transposase n=1 Tax=Meganyctiphanes norvegica TaxID=48144 RepID=A0AAV2RCE2_MEGNR
MVWMDTDDIISNTDALWHPNMPGSRVTTDYCLLMLSIERIMNEHPTQSLYTVDCSSTKNNQKKDLYALCEHTRYPIENMFSIFKLTNHVLWKHIYDDGKSYYQRKFSWMLNFLQNRHL